MAFLGLIPKKLSPCVAKETENKSVLVQAEPILPTTKFLATEPPLYQSLFMSPRPST